MSIFDKLKFWKKGDDMLDSGFGSADSGFGQPQGQSFGNDLPDFGNQNLGQQPPEQNYNPPQFTATQSSYTPSSQSSNDQNYKIAKDIEVISSKLDAIRAAIDSISQRLANLERLADTEMTTEQRRRW